MGQPLSIKDAETFRSAIALYEKKEYKKSLAEVDQLIKRRKSQVHGESLCLKALLLHHLKSDPTGAESRALFKEGLQADPKSDVALHMLGIFHKLRKEHDLAFKAYMQSFNLNKDNYNVHLDTSMLAAHIRDFNALTEVRHKSLMKKMELRMSWTGLVVAQFLAKKYKEVEKTVDLYNQAMDLEKATSTSKSKTEKAAHELEESEMLLVRNMAIMRQNDYPRSLEYLKEVESRIKDKLAFLETKAHVLVKCKKYDEADKVYRELLDRNPDNVHYYHELELLSTDLPKLYAELVEKYPKSLVVYLRQMELCYGEKYEKLLTAFVQMQLERGVPSTFALVEPFYELKETAVIIEKHMPEFKADPIVLALFKASHYSYSQDHVRALDLLSSLKSEDVDVDVDIKLVYAKLLTRAGDFTKAFEVYLAASEQLPGDRLLNTRATTAAFRCGNLAEGYRLAYKFPIAGKHAKNDEEALEFLMGVESVNVILEMAEAHHRLGDHGMALKRASQIIEIFQNYRLEEFDFHFYGPRKGTLRAYLEMVDYEDHIFEHRAYQRAVAIACMELIDSQSKFPDGLSDEVKASMKKTRVKQLESLDLKKDADPFGLTALESPAELLKAIEWAKSLGKHGLLWLTQIYTAQKKYVLAVQSLKKANEAEITRSALNCHAAQIKYTLENDEKVPDVIRQLQMKLLPTIAQDGDIAHQPIKEYVDLTVKDLGWWLRTRIQTGEISNELGDKVAQKISDLEDVDLAEKIYLLLKRANSVTDKFVEAINQKWPCATFMN